MLNETMKLERLDKDQSGIKCERIDGCDFTLMWKIVILIVLFGLTLYGGWKILGGFEFDYS